MLRLHQFPVHEPVINFSPFCLKLETYLRMAKIDYEPVFDMTPGKGPKKKLPFIEDGSVNMGDSGMIIEYLKKTYGDPLDAWLSPDQVAVGHAFRALLEDRFTFLLVYWRWQIDATWQVMKPLFFRGMPGLLMKVIPDLVRRGMLKKLHGQGVGRHKESEVFAMARQDLAAVAQFLGDKPYAHGSRPSSLDAVMFAFLTNVLHADVINPAVEFARSQANLVAYCDRMRREYFPEYSKG